MVITELAAAADNSVQIRLNILILQYFGINK